ncbi:BRO-N domain-containing protein [Hymenobacter convexus]|uniref:BRO-N domain-containing protein n=1 Tax=Hymenobacter sp. CA1UV-4 TaxID=3063782 RepID=UPI00271330C4|nr:Bro-N domain-containing protein [Hymenobacter sp. CA1UV-4]MDO7852962.1 Bro-N domain-containing protein [Hymenobacter sp. CA1UV-4]
MSMQLAIFKYEDKEEEQPLSELTTIDIDGEPWFVANEICALLDIKNPRDAVASLDDDEKLVSALPTSGQVRNVNIVNESGLYTLIFRSNKPSAKKFRKWITNVVLPTIRKTGAFGVPRSPLPIFVTRYNDNWDRTSRGHFSVISELFIRLYGRFEQIGYRIPDKAFATGAEIRPDVSVGRGFSAFLTAHHPSVADNYTRYSHRFPNGSEVQARQYPNELLPLFIQYIDNHWLPNSAPKYFLDRDRAALDYLPKLLER